MKSGNTPTAGVRRRGLPNAETGPSQPAPRVALVDADPSVHLSLRHTLETQAKPCALVDYFTGPEALPQIAQAAPATVLMEVALPGWSGIECAARLHHLLPRLPIVMFTGRADAPTIIRSLMAGARGYLLKSASAQETAQVIQCAWVGRPTLCLEALESLISYYHRAGASAAPLTATEQQILLGLREGLRRKEIAAKLQIETGTVNTHLNRMCRKAGVRGRASLLSWWFDGY